jgi:hypothetical protein
MAKIHSPTKQRCPECGAEVEGFEDCWLCQGKGANRQISPPQANTAVLYPPPAKGEGSGQSADWWLIVGSVVLTILIFQVGISLFSYDATLAILFWIVGVPGLIAISATIYHRTGRAGDASLGQTIAKTFLHIGWVVGLVVLIIFGICAALFAICMGIFALSN